MYVIKTYPIYLKLFIWIFCHYSTQLCVKSADTEEFGNPVILSRAKWNRQSRLNEKLS